MRAKCGKNCFNCARMNNGNTFLRDDLKVVTLYGRGSKGKTTTLVLTLIKLLLNNNVCISKCVYKNFTLNDIMKEYKAGQVGDFTCALTVKTDNGDKTIGFTTVGDTCWQLIDAFKNCGNCDLYVCASHMSKQSDMFIDNITKNGVAYKYSRTTAVQSGALKSANNAEKDLLNDLQSTYLAKIILNLL